MMRRARYQRGSLRLRGRSDGPKVWEYRWREIQTDGTRKRRAVIVGSVEEYPTESDAQAAADGLRLNINDPTRRGTNKDITVEALVNHYSEHELPDIFHKDDPAAQVLDDEERKTYSTQHTYDGYLRKWVLPRWRSHKLSEVKAVEVEKWLKQLCFGTVIHWRKAVRPRSETS